MEAKIETPGERDVLVWEIKELLEKSYAKGKRGSLTWGRWRRYPMSIALCPLPFALFPTSGDF